MLNVPFPIIRLGEVYLNYAEAVNEYYGTSKQDEALYYLNEIRTRAGIPAYEGTYSQEQMREMIRHERKIELAWECNRYFDVRRWFTAHGPNGELTTTHTAWTCRAERRHRPVVLHPDESRQQALRHPALLPAHQILGSHAQHAVGAGALLLAAGALPTC